MKLKHLNSYDQNSVNEEFFGVSVEEVMNPRVDQLISYLQKYREEINQPNAIYNRMENRKVENMWNYIIEGMDLDTISRSNRQSDRVTGNGEKLKQRVDRSLKNF